MPKEPLQQACDACRRRKVKCTSHRPCSPCRSTGLACRSSRIRLKKGRQGRSANVLYELQMNPDEEQTSSSLPEENIQVSRPTGLARKPGLLGPDLVGSCVEYFCSRMLGTVPILHPDTLQKHVDQIDNCENSYCLVTAFCAFVIIQTGYLSCHDDVSPEQGRSLLDEAIAARRELDPLVAPIRHGITITFLLYGCHIGLGNQRHAYYFLREATTLYTADMLDQPGVEGEERDPSFSRRLFWLLFISERAHAIRRHRPITLQITAESPALDETSSEDVFSLGFRCLVNLYRPFDESFLGFWNGTQPGCSRDALIKLEEQLQHAVPSDLDLPDNLLADLRVSQQWLRTMIWQLATTAGFLSSTPTHPCLDFRYPLQIARDLSLATWKLSRESMETHGVGLIEKIFEVACTLTDVMACLSSAGLRSSGFEMGPQDYLKHLSSLVDTLPGGRGRFVPLLLAKVGQTLPSMMQPICQHLSLPDLADDTSTHKNKTEAIAGDRDQDFNWTEMSRIGDATLDIDKTFQL